jgi:hypothetical protein
MRSLAGKRSAAGRRIAVGALALVGSLALGVASASAGSGGVGPGGGGETGGGGGGADRCARAQFGERALERGDCGGDVETLNWILKARNYGVSLDRRFDRSTDRAVRDVQRDKDLKASGVVNSRTRKLIVAGMNNPLASWYGPGFFGNRTACGQTLRRKTVGVAHRRLPCGTKVVIGYGGRFIRTRVIDRGPYVKRNYTRDFDLTRALARKLNFDGADRVRSAVVK